MCTHIFFYVGISKSQVESLFYQIIRANKTFEMSESRVEKLVELKGDLDSQKLSECILQLFLRDYIPDEETDTPGTLKQAIATAMILAKRYQTEGQHDYFVLQVRSVPVRDFAFLLRHYFVRLDELVEIHPGNEQRVALRGWHAATDLATDRLEANYELCYVCFNDAIRALWRSTRHFNFSFKNCDHNCNNSQQSVGIALCIFSVLSALSALLFEGVWVFFLLILIILALFFAFLHYAQTGPSIFLTRLPDDPQFFRCRHLSSSETKNK